MTTAATVRLQRKGWGSSGSRRSRLWKVVIDGNVVGSIHNKEIAELPVTPGRHSLEVRSMRHLVSPEVPFEVTERQILGFSCHPRSLSPIILPRWIVWLLATLIKNDLWIDLRPTTPARSSGVPTSMAHQQGDVKGDPTGAQREPSNAGSDMRTRAFADARAWGDTRAEPALVVNHLTKRFGERIAFSEVSFEVGHGEVFGFLGPNGAGKTTTVRTLGTLIAPTSGSATVAGIPLSPENGMEIRRRISVMPESPGLYLRLTITENLEFFAGLYGLQKVGDRVKDALEAVNLADRASDLCGGLSKGLRQRVGLARALLSDPTVMFLDEPTSGLDPVAAFEVHDLINGLREKGTTIFLTTHRLDEAEKLCDRVAILNTTLRTVGRPEELRAELFKRALIVKTHAPLSDADQVFKGIPSVNDWSSEGPGSYVLSVSDPEVAAPEVARSLVGSGADVLFIGEAQHSLEDVYLELIDQEAAANPR